MANKRRLEKPLVGESQDQVSRSDQGRASYHEGYAFESRVAEIYRLMHYDVVHGRLFEGRQVDLFLTNRLGDLTIYRAIECKAGTIGVDDLDSFIAKLKLVRREFPSAQGTIVSGSQFTNAVSSHAAAEGIQLTLFRDLAGQLLDGHGYVTNLIKECSSNARYPIDLYIEPLIGYEAIGPASPAFAFIDEWLEDPDWNQLTLLGDVGTGKSFLSRMVAYNLAKKFSLNPLTHPLPVLIDLRNAERQFSLEGLILTHFAQSGLTRTTFEVFQHALSNGNLILILDGFDEMAARVTRQVTNRNFHELMRSVQGKAKVLLTCRTHYFKSRTEEEEVVFGSKQDYSSETARDLYWELIARKGFRIAYLRQFEIPQIEEYVQRAKPTTAREALRKIRATYNLMELSQRPMLLEMIVKSIDRLNAPEINATTLYEIFTDAWIHRDRWRDVLSPDAKLSFLTALALSLWNDDVASVHHSRLYEYLHQQLAKQIQDEREFVEIDSEIRTASFLVRDDVGNYGFAHKSYAEFFKARYIAEQIKLGRYDCLDSRRLSPEIVHFLRNMVDIPSTELALESILKDPYRPRISENALMCLYGFRRQELVSKLEEMEQDSDQFSIDLPDGIDLRGAQLEQLSLDGAVMHGVDLTGANLSEAIITSADFEEAVLSAASLEKANLSRSNLAGAVLTSANLTACNLENCDLTNANLADADLSDSFLMGATFENADLTAVVLRGAALPTILKLRLDLGNSDSGKKPAESGKSISDQYWEIIESHYPFLLRTARLFSVGRDVEPEDVVSELAVVLMSPQHLDRLVQMDPNLRTEYLYEWINKTTGNLALHRDRTFGQGIRDYHEGEIILPDDDETHELEIYEDEAATLEMDELDVEVEYIEKSQWQVSVDPLEEEKPDFETISLANLDANAELVASSTLASLETLLTFEMQEILSTQLWRIVRERFLYGYDLDDIAKNENTSRINIQRQLNKAKEILRRHFRIPSPKLKPTVSTGS